MTSELFNESETPFNLAGEQIDNTVTPEGEARVRALAQREARKAQRTMFCPNCDGALRYHDGFLGYSSMICDTCKLEFPVL